ncbi:uncharacterized protein LOC117342036 [Pecten maximus]|uniref:uncharacterized protein LOC117342036 n=1 Tax=Pecten maximus TaxID=6579 RepID=UPI0014587C12|nr:uncharacterized protein LOC117342036 [Pecten maximus]
MEPPRGYDGRISLPLPPVRQRRTSPSWRSLCQVFKGSCESSIGSNSSISCGNSSNSSSISCANSSSDIIPSSNSTTKNPSVISKHKCKCNTKCIPVICLLIFLLSAFMVAIPFILYDTEEDACQRLPNEIICPFKQEYSRIDILNPLVHLENGGGRVSFDLKDGTDIVLQGFNIRVANQKVFVRKQSPDCEEEGEYPVKFIDRNVNDTELKESRLLLKVKDWNNAMKMEITPFTNISDNKVYVQIVCSGYHRCGTVVVNIELKLSDYGTSYKPMNCSRTNADGDVFDNYGYACTIFMDVDMFQRTGSLKCKPMVESLEDATADYLSHQSVDVYNSTESHFRLKKGQNATIKWNVNVQKLKDIRQLQTNLNGLYRPSGLATHARFQLFVSIKGYVATCEVRLRPVTCIDVGPWELQMQNGDTQNKRIHVEGLSTFTACPDQITVLVGGQLNLVFHTCIPDGFNTYSVDMCGRTNRSGSIQGNAAIEISDQRSEFRGSLELNELSVTFKMWHVTCADHMENFNLALGTTGAATSEQFLSFANVIGRYGRFSTGGDFRENFPSVVNLRIHLGCRPQKLEINVNGSFLADAYNITEDSSTGEKMFSKSFSFPKVSMLDNGTTVALYSSFIDDQGFPKNISIEQDIRVVPENFCQEKPYGCNYRHPYNANMMVACGEGIIAAFRNCQTGLVFSKSSCVGQCCPEGSTTNCQRP